MTQCTFYLLNLIHSIIIGGRTSNLIIRVFALLFSSFSKFNSVFKPLFSVIDLSSLFMSRFEFFEMLLVYELLDFAEFLDLSLLLMFLSLVNVV